MKPYRQSPKLKEALRKREVKQDALVERFLSYFDGYFNGLADSLIEKFHASRSLPKMPINIEIHHIIESFMLSSVHAGFATAREEDPTMTDGKKAHLAKSPKANLPRDAKSLNDLFKDKKAFQRFMRRSGKLSDGLRRAYLERLTKKFQEVMPKILEAEITPAQAKAEMRGAWGATRSRASTIFRTETTKYFAQAQISYYKDNPKIIGFLYDTIRDSRRTSVCKSRHGVIFRPGTNLLKQNTPPLHYNCRSHIIPLADTAANRRMLADPSRDPTLIFLVPIPSDWRKAG